MAEPVLQEDVLVNFIVGDEKLEAMARKIAQNINSVQDATNKLTIGKYFTKLGDELLGVGSTFEKLFPADILKRGVENANSILKAVESIGASAGMTQKQFADMQAGIAQAAAETGLEFRDMANAAKELYGSTGMKEGLGQTVLDAERLGMVFGASSASFSKLTASMVQFGDGTVKADDVMKSFDKTTGLTGKRMEDALETLTDISKVMRNVVGGGEKFGKSMKEITQFTTQVTAKFTEMGGDSASLNELMKDVMDPNKWGDIASKMPGMAGNLYEMQQAAASGDMVKFGQMLKDGAASTAEMGSGMSVVAKAASGMDFTSAEMLSQIDFTAMGKNAQGGSDIMARSAEMLRSTGDELSKLWNNFSKSIMPVIMPIVSALSTVLSWINRLMQAGDGWAGIIITWGILLTGLAISVTVLWKRMAQNIVKGTVDAAAEAAKGVGKAAGDAVGSFMDTIGKAAAKAAAYALPMMQIGLALLFLAGAVWVMAEAMVVLSGIQNLGTVAAGMFIILAAFAVFAAMAIALTPVVPILFAVAGVFLLFAGAVYIMAAALALAVPSIDMMVGVLWRMAALPMFELATGLYFLTPALFALLAVGMLWGTAGLIAVAGLYLLGGALLLFGSFADSITNFSKSVKDIGSSAASLEKLNSLDFSGIQRLGAAMQSFANLKIEVAVSEASSASIGALLDIVQKVSRSIVDIIAAGRMAIIYAPQMTFIFDYLFNKDSGLLVRSVKQIGDALGTGSLFSIDKSISKNVQDSLNFVISLMVNFSKALVEMITTGQMLMGSAGNAGFITYALTYVITELGAILELIDKRFVSWTGNTTIPKNVQESLSFVLTLMDSFNRSFVDMAAMGAVLMSGTGVGGMIDTAIKFAVDTLKKVIKTIDKEMVSIWGNTTIPKNVQESMSYVLTLMKDFGAMFIDLAVMGSMLAAGAGAAGGVASNIDLAISSVFGEGGFIQKMINGVKDQKVDTKVVSNLSTSIKSIGEMVNPLVDLTAMGSLFKAGEDQNLFAFADTVGTFMSKMHDATSNTKIGDFGAMTAKLSDFGATLNEDVKINAQTGADLALQDHTTATAEHQQNVEDLLESIRDNISQLGGHGSKEVAAVGGNVPPWRPESLFSDVSESF